MSEELARKFHESYERNAPLFGYETREDTKDFDPESTNGKLMIAVCDEVFGQQHGLVTAEMVEKATGIIVKPSRVIGLYVGDDYITLDPQKIADSLNQQALEE